MPSRISHYAISRSPRALLLSPGLALLLAACGDSVAQTSTDTDTASSSGGGSTTGSVDPTSGTVDPTNTPTTTGPDTTTGPTTGPDTTDSTTGTVSTTEPLTTGTTGSTSDTTGGSDSSGSTGSTGSTGADTDTGGQGEFVGVWATSNPAALANDAIVGLTPALDMQAPLLKLLGDVVSIQSVAITTGGDGVITFDAPSASGGVIIDLNLANNPQNGAIGLGDRVIVGKATGLKTPKGVEVGVPGGVFLVADTTAGDIKAFDFDDQGDVAPLYVIDDLGTSSAVWDMHYDSDTDSLYAAGTNGEVQVYEDFEAMKGAGGPDRTIVPFDGGQKASINLHGITVVNDRLILSDVGDANNASDGQLFVINGASNANGNVQVFQRITGGQLGNPVDLELRTGLGERLLVAEKSNDVLIRFTRNLITNNYELEGATMVTKPESVALVPGSTVVVASNPAGLDNDGAAVFSVPALGEPSLVATKTQLGSITSIESVTLTKAGDGLVTFDGPAVAGGGGVFVVSGLTAIDADGDVDTVPGRIWGPKAGIVTPKGLALNAAGTHLFIADTAAADIKVFDPAVLGDTAPLFKFADLGGAAAWDVAYDDDTDTLYAAGVDGAVRVFHGAIANMGANPPDRTITPTDGNAQISVNLHGIHYDPATKILLLSDVGSAMSPSDGQIFLIDQADVADGMVAVLAQIGGDQTKLGNPVDIAFDGVNLYIAEKSNSVVMRYDGVLSLVGPNNMAESVSIAVPSAESVALEYTNP